MTKYTHTRTNVQGSKQKIKETIQYQGLVLENSMPSVLAQPNPLKPFFISLMSSGQ